MIIYSKTLWGIPLLTRLYGSALPRALAPAVISGLLTIALLLLGDRVQHLWENPFAYQPFVLIVSFVLTFRSNYAYQRHWEAYTQTTVMTARWLDAAVQIIMFDKHPIDPLKHQQQQHNLAGGAAGSRIAAVQSHQQFVAELVHLISLLHAVACAALRRDPDLTNLTRHSRLSAAPPSDPALLDRTTLPLSSSTSAPAAAAGVDYSDGARTPGLMQWADYRDVNIVGAANWRDIFMLRGSSNTIRKYNAAQPLPIIGGLSRQEAAALGCRHDCQHELDLDEAAGLCTAETWGGVVSGRYPTTAAAAAKHAKQRKTSSSIPVMNTAATGTADNNSTLWGLLRHRQQLQQHRGGLHPRSQSLAAEPSTHYSVAGSLKSNKSGGGGKPLVKRSLTRRFKVSQNHACCVGHLPYMDRPMLVLAWVHELLLQRQEAGGLRMPAPILARVHTGLSEGLLGFEQCRKLADTPFPFPWAQFVLVMLVLFTLTLPLLVLAYVAHSVLAVVVTVMTVSTYWAVNEVARDVEDPFLYEPNDMPLANGQYHINEMLLALSAAERPASGVLPVHLPMAAAAATCGGGAGGVGGLPGLAVRVGSAVQMRSAASASWPDLRHAAASGESDHDDGDDSCHDSRGFCSHSRLATIVSGDAEGQLQAAAAVAAAQAAAPAVPLAASPSAPAAYVHNPPDHSSSHTTDVTESSDTHVKRVMYSSSGGGGSRTGTTGGAAAVGRYTTHSLDQLDTAGHRDIADLQTAAATEAGGRYSLSANALASGLKCSTAAAAVGDVAATYEALDGSRTVADMV